VVQGEFLIRRKKVDPYFFPEGVTHESLAEPDDSWRKEQVEKQLTQSQPFAVSFDRKKGAHHV
jgi:hypothetical protein